VLVNAACPGFVATDLNGFRGHKTPEEGAAIALHLATLPDDGPTGGCSTTRASCRGESGRGRSRARSASRARCAGFSEHAIARAHASAARSASPARSSGRRRAGAWCPTS
jgi:hypothetical protein